jgi:uncharacterized RDD family membrane protein YckC
MITSTGAAPLDTTADVETPEHVRFSYQLAGPSRRALAYLIDALIRGVIFVGVIFVASVAGAFDEDGLGGMSMGVGLVLLFALEWGYFMLFELLWSGRTPGKKAMKIRVVREEGVPMSVMDTVLRNLLRAADFLPVGYAIGLVVMARDARFRRLGDLVAGTMVVTERRQGYAAPLAIHPPPTDKELAGLPSRPPLDRDDLDAIELFLRRLGTLAPLRELELAEMIAPVYAQRMGVRYRDPTRFLALLYHRAHERKPGGRAA